MYANLVIGLTFDAICVTDRHTEFGSLTIVRIFQRPLSEIQTLRYTFATSAKFDLYKPTYRFRPIEFGSMRMYECVA